MDFIIVESGQVIHNIHDEDQCKGHHCVLHNPSDHAMESWPLHWREDLRLMERICPHGIGHPDPDDIAYKRRVGGDEHARLEAIHGCDGCCEDN